VIIALAALRAGLHDVVKASIVGSIVGNILLVLGAAMLAGGIRHEEQHFNAAGARSQATMLTLAAIALIVPAAYRALVAEHVPGGQGALSVSISVVLLAVYGMFLLFSLRTHSALFAGFSVSSFRNLSGNSLPRRSSAIRSTIRSSRSPSRPNDPIPHRQCCPMWLAD
jgi:Ca2+:H+ antiporter